MTNNIGCTKELEYPHKQAVHQANILLLSQVNCKEWQKQ